MSTPVDEWVVSAWTAERILNEALAYVSTGGAEPWPDRDLGDPVNITRQLNVLISDAGAPVHGQEHEVLVGAIQEAASQMPFYRQSAFQLRTQSEILSGTYAIWLEDAGIKVTSAGGRPPGWNVVQLLAKEILMRDLNRVLTLLVFLVEQDELFFKENLIDIGKALTSASNYIMEPRFFANWDNKEEYVSDMETSIKVDGFAIKDRFYCERVFQHQLRLRIVAVPEDPHLGNYPGAGAQSMAELRKERDNIAAYLSPPDFRSLKILRVQCTNVIQDYFETSSAILTLFSPIKRLRFGIVLPKLLSYLDEADRIHGVISRDVGLWGTWSLFVSLANRDKMAAGLQEHAASVKRMMDSLPSGVVTNLPMWLGILERSLEHNSELGLDAPLNDERELDLNVSRKLQVQ